MLFISLLLSFTPYLFSQNISILGNSYNVQVVSSQTGLAGTSYKELKVSAFPLKIFVHEIDITNPKVSIEAWKGQDNVFKTNTPLTISRNKTYTNHQVLSAINGGFYVMSGEWASVTTNGDVINGEIYRSPALQGTDEYGPSVAFDKKNKPFVGNLRFTGSVITPNGACKVTAVNNRRWEDDLIVYTSRYGSNTRSNAAGTEVLVAPLFEKWEQITDYDNVHCKVEAISSAGSMTIPAGKIILSGHGASQTFLNQLNIGDDVYVNLTITKESNPGFIKKGTQSLQFNAVNATRETNYLVLYNSSRGINTGTNIWGTEILVSPTDYSWNSLGDPDGVKCKVEKIVSSGSGGSMAIPNGKIVISGHGTASDFLSTLTVGSEINVHLPELKNIIGGHRVVLNAGVPAPATTSSADVGTARHPRTAVGYSGNGNKVYFVVVDGRSTASVGVTSRELADVMTYLGCQYAINLDGGGSSCIVVNDAVKNVPSDGAARSVADGLFSIYKSTLSYNHNSCTLRTKIELGDPVVDLYINLYDSQGNKVTEICRQKNVPAGNYDIVFDGRNLPSGHYSYEVISDNVKNTGNFTIE